MITYMYMYTIIMKALKVLNPRRSYPYRSVIVVHMQALIILDFITENTISYKGIHNYQSNIFDSFSIQAKHIDLLPFSNTDILSKTYHGCSTVLHFRLLRVKEQEETLVNINTLLNFHIFAHAHYTKLSHVYTKNGEIKVHCKTLLDYPFVSRRY